MSFARYARKALCRSVGALFVCATACAEPPDPTLLASFKKYSTPVVRSYQGGVCKSVVTLPKGQIGYVDSMETKSNTLKGSDALTLLLGGRRVIAFTCGAPVSDMATPEAFIATMRNGKDTSIDRSSVVVHSSTLGGLPATRIDLLLSDDPSPPGKRWHRTDIMALERLPSGLVVQHFWTLATTADRLKEDDNTFETLLTSYRPDGSGAGASPTPIK